MLQLLIIAIIVGAVCYVVRLLPIEETFKTIVVVIAVVVSLSTRSSSSHRLPGCTR
jgi:hypothetical protein